MLGNNQQPTRPADPRQIDLSALVASELVNPPLPHSGKHLTSEQQRANQEAIDAAIATIQALVDEVKFQRTQALSNRLFWNGHSTRQQGTITGLQAEVKTLEDFIRLLPAIIAAVFANGSASNYDQDITGISVDAKTQAVSYQFGNRQFATHKVPPLGDQQHTIRIGNHTTMLTSPAGEIGFGQYLPTVRGLPFRPPETAVFGGLSVGLVGFAAHRREFRHRV